MSHLSFFRYPFGSVIRNKRRSLFAIAGIVIALSLISGSWIAVDSSGMGLLRAKLRQIPVDFQATGSYGIYPDIDEHYFQERIGAIENVRDVVDASAYAASQGWYYSNSLSETLQNPWGWGNFSGTLVFVPEDYGRLLSAYKIVGGLPDSGTVAVSEHVMDELNMSLGDNMTCRLERWSWLPDEWGNYSYAVEYLNLSFKISQVWTQDKSDFGSNYWYYYSDPDDPGSVVLGGLENPVIFNLADLPSVETPASVLDPYWALNSVYPIWVDRDKLVDLADLRGSINRLNQMQSQLDRLGVRYSFTVSDSALIGPIEDLIPRMEGIKPLFVALSLPIVALGVYLSMVGVDLGLSERKREVAILKSRGASNRQVFLSLIMESLLLGSLAGVLGLLLGVAVSRFLLDAAVVFSYEGAGETLASDFMISGSTIIFSVLFAVALMLLSSYRPFKRMSKTDVREALAYYSPSIVQIDYKPRTDIIFLSLSVLSVISVWLGIEWATGLYDLSWITRLIVTILILVGYFMFPLMPFLLSLSVIRLLTRGSRKLYAKLTFIVKPWTKELHYLVDRNIVRNPKRASSLCLIIALAMAFGLFISVTMESTIRYQENLIKFDVGADIRTYAYTYWSGEPSDYDREVLDDIVDVEGVDSYCLFYGVKVSYGYSGSWGGMETAIFDTRDYDETVHPDKFYFVDGGRGSLDDLSEINGTVLISDWLSEYNGLYVGDEIPLVLDMSSYYDGWYQQKIIYLWAEVAGIVKTLPGLDQFSIFMDEMSLDFVPKANFTEMASSYGAFVNVLPGYTQARVADDVEGVFRNAGISATSTTVDDRMEELGMDPAYRALTDFLYMEYVLSVVIMTIGVGVLIFVAVNDREKELASIMARGSSGAQIRKILMGESFTLMVLGLIVGASVGLLTAYLFQSLYAGGGSSVVPREVVFTWISAMIVVASVAALILASLVATSRAGKIKLAEVLRIRGG